MADALSLNERRGDDADRRSPLAPLGNGKAEWVRWLFSMLISAIAATLIAWNAVTSRISVIEEREQNHYEELLRQFRDLREDIRALGKQRD